MAPTSHWQPAAGRSELREPTTFVCFAPILSDGAAQAGTGPCDQLECVSDCVWSRDSKSEIKPQGEESFPFNSVVTAYTIKMVCSRSCVPVYAILLVLRPQVQ